MGSRLMVLRFVVSVGILFFLPNRAGYAASKQFVVPLSFLESAAASVQIELDVNIDGHSALHPVASDCEMHFGGHSDDFSGDPDGLVLEPMNLCVEKPPQGTTWTRFGNQVVSAGTVHARGVPRIWPEHLQTKEEASNPRHAVELHPLTLLNYAGKTKDFASFIYAPDGFDGGVSEFGAGRILTTTTVSVSESQGSVAITFNYAGSPGNFTTADVTIRSVDASPGGHVVMGDVTVGDAEAVPIRILTVTGSPIDTNVSSLIGRTVTALVLFALNPKALHDAALTSHGSAVTVTDALELILYGEHETG